MLEAAWGALSAHARAPRSKFHEISLNLGAGSSYGARTEHASCRTGPSRVTLSKAHSYSILGHPGTIHGALHQLPTPHSSLSPNFDLMPGRNGAAVILLTFRGRTLETESTGAQARTTARGVVFERSLAVHSDYASGTQIGLLRQLCCLAWQEMRCVSGGGVALFERSHRRLQWERWNAKAAHPFVGFCGHAVSCCVCWGWLGSDDERYVSRFSRDPIHARGLRASCGRYASGQLPAQVAQGAG